MIINKILGIAFCITDYGCKCETARFIVCKYRVCYFINIIFRDEIKLPD